ncbi:MAG: serine/threonine-protein kinase [Acidobacteriota bacterium]
MDHEHWRRLDQLLGRALELEGDARSRFLAEACSGDTEMLDEVESLLRFDATAVPLLDDLQPLPLPAAVPRSGDRIGAWRLGRRLGAGGTSIVFAGQRDEASFEQRVAIKVLFRNLLDEQALDRFHRECRILARLQHPAIARLYDAGVTRSGLPFLVLERVDGLRLDRWVETAPDLEARLQLFEKICRAVAFAHRNLVVHRDLKPGNILVTTEGEPKLLDFGIAQVLAQEGEPSTRLTRTGHAQPMTPQYASPEQLRGEDVTTASDVYALGVVFFELLTGAPPYRLANGRIDEALARLGSASPPLPSTHLGANRRGSPRASEVRGDLDRIVVTAMTEEVEQRYPSARVLAEEVGRFRAGRPIVARSPSKGYLVRRFVARHRLAVAGVAAFVLFAVAAAVVFAVLARRYQQAERWARQQAAGSFAVEEFFIGVIADADPIAPQSPPMMAR